MEPTDKARQVGVVDSWDAQGSVRVGVTDPALNDVAIDTGPLAAGYYDFMCAIAPGPDVKALEYEHRNAANTATLHAMPTRGLADLFIMIKISNWKFATNERLRCTVGVVWAGTVRFSIWWTRRA